MTAKANWWQWGVMGAALLATAGAAWWSLRAGERVRFATEIHMVDVTTGELFVFALDGRRGVMVPGRNPGTDRLALLPVEKREDGKWYIGARGLAGLKVVEGEPRAVVNPDTGEVNVANERPKRLR
jgi:hypothetical protein